MWSKLENTLCGQHLHCNQCVTPPVACLSGDVVVHDAARHEARGAHDRRHGAGQEPLGRRAQRAPQAAQEKQDP